MVYLKLFGVFLALGALFALVVPKLIGGFMPPIASLNINQPAAIASAAAYDHSNTVDRSGFIKVANQSSTQFEALEKYAQSLPEEKRAKILEQIESMKNRQAARVEKSDSSGTANVKEEKEEDEEQEASKPTDMYKQMADGMLTKFGLPLLALFMLIPFLLYVLAIAATAAYVKSRLGNLVWNNTKLEHIGFSSSLRMRDLIWLYFTNGLALIFSLGLATPWVQIRMARYKAEHLALTGEADLDKFVGEKKASGKALGGEMADMFDMDISFG